MFYENANKVPDQSELKLTDKNLIIFDDFLLEKKQNKCENYYVKGRRSNVDCFYLAQNYFKLPKQSKSNLISIKSRRHKEGSF
jgi:hypothetical protein